MESASLFRLRRAAATPPPFPDHRRFVGGMWEEIGRLQFDFLVSRGLKPHHVLVDIGCGCLRGGRYFIRYLDAGNYLGIDRYEEVIQAGLEHEVPKELVAQKRPEFVVSDKFELGQFSRRPTHALAQSLFTHLAEVDILACLERVRQVVEVSAELYATYFSPQAPPEAFRGVWPAEVYSGDYRNPDQSDHTAPFLYSPDQLEAMADHYGWKWQNLGDWSHPRGQLMGLFIAT